MPVESLLWTLPNVIISPHDAGNTGRNRERVLALLADNLRRYLADGPLRAVVDKRLGY